MNLRVGKKIWMDYIGVKCDPATFATAAQFSTDSTITAKQTSIVSGYECASAISKTSSLEKLGFDLETYDYVKNMGVSYFGDYSEKDLASYRGNNRYVSFVDVAQSKLSYRENNKQKKLMGIVGGSLAGAGAIITIASGAAVLTDDSGGALVAGLPIGLITFFAGGITALCATSPTKTDIVYDGLYTIYVYDLQDKKFVRKDPVTVKLSENFKGSFSYDEGSKNIVYDFIAQNVKNELLKKYDEITRWLEG